MFTSWAIEMEQLILGWYVLVETGSVLLLTVFASLGFVGTLIAPMFGVVGDRIGHRDLLALMRGTYAVLATTLMMLAFSGQLHPPLVFVIALLMGLVRPSDIGVRSALVANFMPHGLLIAAISVSRTTMDTARIAGALSGAGLFATLGIGPAYVAIVTLYIAATLLTLCVVVPRQTRPSAETTGEVLSSPLRDLKEGIAYVWSTPRMQAAMWIAFLANLVAYPLSGGLLPYIARAVYGTNQTGVGYLSAGFALGSLAGSIALSMFGGVRVARLMIASSVLWYGVLVVFVQMQTMPTAILCLMVAGFSQSLTMICLAVILMRTSSEQFRGRVMGVRMMVIYSLPFGLLGAGSLIDTIGFVATGTLYSVSGLVLMIAIALHWRADLWNIHAPANAR